MISRDVTGTTANIANSFTAIIPFIDKYKEYNIWKNLGIDERNEYFTLQNGDTMALGTQTIEITGISPYQESQVKTSLMPEVMTIKAFQDNTASRMGKHWRVEGV